MSIDSTNFNLVAHRGYSSIAPENTMPALELADSLGFSASEVDVRYTKDDVPVLLHDKTITRTSNASLFSYCSNYSISELKTFDFGSWKSKDYQGTTIPTFSQALSYLEDSDMELYVEIKSDEKFNERKAKSLVDNVKAHGLEDKITWISFNSDYLQMISELLPNARLGLLSKDYVDNQTIDTLNSLKTQDNEVFLDIKANKMDSIGDELLDEAGFEFEAWTVDDIKTFANLYSFGCSGITTDNLTFEDINQYLDEQ